jgi:predicted nucleic acid-binding protein
MKYLLDVNLLLASICTSHPEHSRAAHWLAGKRLVVCPLSSLGFLRICSNRRAFNIPMEKARQGLAAFCADRAVEWIADDLKPLESKPLTSDEVTDSYLADLAGRHQLKLATMDEGIKHPAVELVSKEQSPQASS